jgi:plastocyanin
VNAKTLAIARIAVTVFFGAATFATGQEAEVSMIELTVGDNMRFTPSVIQAHPGQRVRILLRRVGKLPALAHNVVLLKKGTAPKAFIDKASKATEETGSIPPAMKDQAIVASALVKPGESAEVTFEAPAEPGEYTFVCSFPGHFGLGMKGQLIVK